MHVTVDDEMEMPH